MSRSPRRVLVAPDKFKGSLTGAQAAAHIARGISAAVAGVEVRCQPIADGGEGTVDAAVAAGFERRTRRVNGPLEPVSADFAIRGEVAVVELAQAAGLQLLNGRFAPLRASTLGGGELMLAAVDAGARTVVLGVGGVASTDGALGLLTALGVRFLDTDGQVLTRGCGADLPRVAGADLAGLRLPGIEVVLASDVDNPLLGARGAAAVYGPQKGAAAADVALLEAGLGNLVRVLGAESATAAAQAVAASPGAGAAGGVGFGVMCVLGARRRPGFEVIAELVGFDDLLDGVDLVVTGEGSLDEQSLHGKAPVAVAARARARGIPVLVLCGVRTVSDAALAEHGISRALALSDVEPDPQRSMADAGPLLERLAATALG